MNSFTFTCIHTQTQTQAHTQVHSIGSVPLENPDSWLIQRCLCNAWYGCSYDRTEKKRLRRNRKIRTGFKSNVPQNESDFLEGGLPPGALLQNLSVFHLLIWIWLGDQWRAISSLIAMKSRWDLHVPRAADKDVPLLSKGAISTCIPRLMLPVPHYWPCITPVT